MSAGHRIDGACLIVLAVLEGLTLDHKLHCVATMVLARVRIWVGAAVIAAVFGMTVNHTHAQANRTVPFADVRVGHQRGAFVSTDVPGILIGFDAAVRVSVLELGVLLEIGGLVFTNRASSVAATGGVSWQMANGLRLHLLGVYGSRHYSGVGADGLFGDDPGASAVMSYAGATGGASYRFRRSNKRSRLMVGARVSVEDDLERVARTYRYCGRYCDGSEYQKERRSIGATRGSLVLSVGVLFDL